MHRDPINEPSIFQGIATNVSGDFFFPRAYIDSYCVNYSTVQERIVYFSMQLYPVRQAYCKMVEGAAFKWRGEVLEWIVFYNDETYDVAYLYGAMRVFFT